MESHFYDTDIAASKEAVFLITKFNSKGCIDRMVKVNLPEVWTLMHIADTILLDAKFYRNLSLPVIKSSSPTQSTLASGDASALYLPHLGWTKAFVLYTRWCLFRRGGADRSCSHVRHTGIWTYRYGYDHHVWRRLRHQTAYYRRSAGTTMEQVPTRNSRAPLSRQYY